MQSTTTSTETIVQRYRANRPQQYIKTLKEVTIEATRLKTLRVKELIIRKTKTKLKILAEKDI